MSFAAYGKYKQSGVQWLPPIPEHWAVRRLKHVSRVLPSNVDKKTTDGEPGVRLCNYTDVYYNDVIDETLPYMSASASLDQLTRFSLRAGDTIITKDSETADDIAVSAFVPADLPTVVCGYHLAIVRPSKGTSGAYVKRVFDSVWTKAAVEVRANGLTRVGLGQYELDNLEIPFPTPEEQQNIAAFLDSETAKTDALVAQQRRLIELLKEKRQAVISHAVTKGLNAGAPMKPSGIDWLGYLPAHWDAVRLKHLVADSISGPYGAALTKDMYSSSGYRVYGQQQVIIGDFAVGDYYVTPEKFDEMRRYSVSPGDVLVTVMGTIGRVAVVPLQSEAGIINPRLAKYRCNERIEPMFLGEALMSPLLQEHLALAAQGTTMAGLNMQILGGVPIPLPPITEQRTLVEFVTKQKSRFDGLVGQAQSAIELLQERRTALISAAVTGQIDVRGLVPVETA
jgi:type I restriction enzyme S subunit